MENKEDAEETFEINVDAPLSRVFSQIKNSRKQKDRAQLNKPVELAPNTQPGQFSRWLEQCNSCSTSLGITTSIFDYSVENHFNAVDTISKLCGEPEIIDCNETEVQRLSNSITFLREWRNFSYVPRTISFACQKDSNSKDKDLVGQITLPQFSAAEVPKVAPNGGTLANAKSSKDIIMYVGGNVWALDWCPRVDHISHDHIRSEFLAVAAHPPESSYHKIGVPLVGRGVIQIWCLLNVCSSKDIPSSGSKTRKLGSKKNRTVKADESKKPKRPRGRPRKKPIDEPVEKIDSDSEHMQPLAIEYPEESSGLYSERASANTTEQVINQDFGIKLVDSVNVDASLLSSQVNKKPELGPKVKETVGACKLRKPQRPRGRPRKKPRDEALKKINSDCQHVETLAIEYPDNLSGVDSAEKASAHMKEQVVSEGSRSKHDDLVNADALIMSSQVNENPALSSKENKTIKAQKSTELRRRKGRQKKKPVEKINSDSESVQPLASEYSGDFSKLHSLERASANTKEQLISEDSGTKLDDSVNKEASKGKSTARKRDWVHSNVLHGQDEHIASSLSNGHGSASCSLDSIRPTEKVTSMDLCDANNSSCCVPKDIALPTMILCLAHNGKVAWDVKWRPFNVHDSESMHRMGYLAVLLGNGALEVWEVPFPRTIKLIYAACQKEGTDPRFVKLAPVFRCSMLKRGDRQSIPLTVEWSTSSMHDLILAGCHDGVVALWKFSTTGSSIDTRPLLCFSADTGPIRSLAWAPVYSDTESTNVIVTAGHKGLKFWDIRDPFRPLWDINPVQAVINSLDWLPDPRCIIGSCDDGSIWILSLMKAACDIPVTGKPFSGTQKQGIHSYQYSSFSIWSIQASRRTGMVAYCGEDGTAFLFQLTTRAVEKDPSRNRPLHFLSGSLMEEEPTLTVVSPLTNTPVLIKKSVSAHEPKIKSDSLAVKKQEEQADEQTGIYQASDEQPLALCYEDEPGPELESEDPCMVQKRKPVQKLKTSSKNKLKADKQAQICIGEDDMGNFPGEGSEKGQACQEIKVFPPKIVAFHKVRWNMNKGSEKWLCYGGAGGLLRCQEVNMFN